MLGQPVSRGGQRQRGGQGGSVEDAEVVLRRAPLLMGSTKKARALRGQMSDVKLSRGERLFLEGQDGDRLYVVLDGKIKLTRAAADGRETCSVCWDPARCSASCRCSTRARGPPRRAPSPRRRSRRSPTTRCAACCLSGPKYHAHAAGAGQAAAAGQRRGGRPGLHRRPGPGGEKPARPGRPVRRAGIRRAARPSRPDPGGTGPAGGASRETVNKALADFAARGWLQISARSVLILDVERLRKRAR